MDNLCCIWGRERERIIRAERENNKMTNNRLDSEKQNIDTER